MRLRPLIGLGVLFAVAALHLVAIVASSVNLPYMDEWEALTGSTLAPALNWSWVFMPHNEHRIVPTKILTWILYKSTGWHHIANVVCNFFLYLAELCAFIWMTRRAGSSRTVHDTGGLTTAEFIWCLLGLSGLAWENPTGDSGYLGSLHWLLRIRFPLASFARRPWRVSWRRGQWQV
ncbi:hypothetical protein EBZ80_17745 [bacterium]|nr:hypothetical protein [bacterium]